jgi:hypothetical protein
MNSIVNLEGADMISLTIQIDDPQEADVTALSEFVRRIKGSDAMRLSEDRIPNPTLSELNPGRFISEDKQLRRQTMGLLAKFEERNWRIPKKDIAELNREVFVNVRKAAPIYRSQYFEFDAKTQEYVATEEAKEALSVWRHDHNNVHHFLKLSTAGSASDPSFHRNPMVKGAIEAEGFFSDLTAEGLEALQTSMNDEENETAKKWLAACMEFLTGQFSSGTSLPECFEILDNVRSYLDWFAATARNNAAGTQ